MTTRRVIPKNRSPLRVNPISEVPVLRIEPISEVSVLHSSRRSPSKSPRSRRRSPSQSTHQSPKKSPRKTQLSSNGKSTNMNTINPYLIDNYRPIITPNIIASAVPFYQAQPVDSSVRHYVHANSRFQTENNIGKMIERNAAIVNTRDFYDSITDEQCLELLPILNKKVERYLYNPLFYITELSNIKLFTMDDFVHYCREMEQDIGKIDLLHSKKSVMFRAFKYWIDAFNAIFNSYLKGNQMIDEETFIKTIKDLTFMLCYTYISMRRQGYIPEDDRIHSLQVIRYFIILKFYFT
jgi:hypothetical protein